MGFGQTSHQVFIHSFVHSFIHSFIQLSMALQPFVGPWLILQFRNFFTETAGPLGLGIGLSHGLYLHTG
jgi:hypothetical protein